MTLNELYQQICTKHSIESKLEELYAQQNHLEKKINVLKSKWQKEQKEADKLEKGSFSSLFYSLTGKLDDKLDREKREALEAKAVYDNAVFQLEMVTRDISRYVKQKYELKDCEAQYEKALQEKLESLKGEDSTIVFKQKELAEAQAAQKEIEEAIAAGKSALNKAYEVQKSLSSADSWAVYDVFGGGLISDAMKYSRLDDATRQIQEMQAHLSKFKTELSDVNINTEITVDISEFLKVSDYLFDNIFTDMTVRSKISAARVQIDDKVNAIDSTLFHLGNMLKSEKDKENKLKQELENLAVLAE